MLASLVVDLIFLERVLMIDENIFLMMLALYSHWLQDFFCLLYASPVCESWVSPCLWICIHMYCRDIWFHSAICSQRLQKYLTPSCTDFIWCRRLGKSFVLYSQRLQEFIVSIPGRGWEDLEWTKWHEDNEGHAGQSKGGGAHTECGDPETEGTAGAPVG